MAQRAAFVFIEELEQEAPVTRRVLERVTDEHLDWRPHPRARSLGELALHVATVPAGVAELGALPSPVPAPDFSGPAPRPERASDLGPALDRSIARAKEIVGGLDDAALRATFRIAKDGRDVVSMPRGKFLRATMLNHWYHHRGQLTVYLRALGLEVPSVYGPSADENAFA
jgi:uncharacterized damage-inducible protein DinB